MGLFDRLRSHEEEYAAKQAAEAESAERILANAEHEQQQTAAKLKQAEAQTRATILATHMPLFNALGARKQLQQLRKFWKTGQVDDAKLRIYPGEGSLPSISYFFHYPVTNKFFEEVVGESTWTEPRTEDLEISSGLHIRVRKEPSPAYSVVTSSYARVLRPRYAFVARYTNYTAWAVSSSLWSNFSPEEPKQAALLLEQSLFSLATRLEPPLNLGAKRSRTLFFLG